MFRPGQPPNSDYVNYQQDYHKPNRRKTTILDPIKDKTRLARAREQATKAEEALERAEVEHVLADILQEQRDRTELLTIGRNLLESNLQEWDKRRSRRMEAESQSVSPEPEVESLKALWSKQVDSPAEEPSSKRQMTDKAPSPAKDSQRQQQTASKVVRTIHETAQPMPNCMLNINNASFLEVWTSVVTQFLHPNLSWTTCLSVGNAIVTICTASDGYHHDPAEDNDHPSKSAAKNELEVMGFRLRLKYRLAVVDNQKRPADEAALKSKFDSKDDYNTLKESLESSLETSHSGCKDNLAEDAWKFYNELRPTVSQGPESWYKKSVFNCWTMHINLVESSGKRSSQSRFEQTMEEGEGAARAFASLPNVPAKRRRR
ncbi:hypothetical protein D6D01_00422 [Aureobasidium pullulans]|uniref:Uncharacterized protein n=1 Tax=Aureobasidium pullulans TaxID=5580 RepID=A0A4S9M205_AURPU|nr:hypothetical protein D6D01_00422 [Aureobasidium pullulans]